MNYFEVLVNAERSIRELATEMGMPWTTLRDRLAKDIPPSKYRNKVPIETVIKADKLLREGFSVREVGKLLEVPKSTLHRQVSKYRKPLV